MGTIGALYGISYGFGILFLIYASERFIDLVRGGINDRRCKVYRGANISIINILYELILRLHRS